MASVEMELCSLCGKAMRPSEETFLHEGSVLCRDCYHVANPQGAPSEPDPVESLPKLPLPRKSNAAPAPLPIAPDYSAVLREIADSTRTIKGWVTFMGVLVLLAVIGEILRTLAIVLRS